MYDLDDFVRWFRKQRFYKTAMHTILLSGSHYAVDIFTILVKNNKNSSRVSFTTKESYLNYLKG